MTSAEWELLLNPLIKQAKDDKDKDMLARLKRIKKYAETRHASTRQDLVFEAYAEICDVDLTICSQRMGARIGRCVQRIRHKYEGRPEPMIIAGLRGFRVWWNEQDFRGLKGQSPTPEQVVDGWQRFAMWHRTNKIGKVKSA